MNCSVTATLLQQLPVQHLTKLSFRYESTPTSDQRMRSSLSKLTSLQELTVQFCSSTDAVVPALSALSNLTKLILSEPVRDVALLQQLPQQLVDLELSLQRDIDDGYGSGPYSGNSDLPQNAVQLGHLTALTRLAMIRYDKDEYPLIIRQHDELPPNMKALFVADCCVCQPLLQLGQLQQLSMTSSTTSKEELQLLSQLTTLTDVSLTYYDDGSLKSHDNTHSDAAAAAWTAVPGLRSLHLTILNDHTQLTDAVAETLHKLTSLTDLVISCKSLYRHTAVCLQQAGAKMTGLKTLNLIAFQIWQAETQPITVPSTAPFSSFGDLPLCSTFASTIAGLPRLSSLELCRFQMTSEAAKIFAGVSQLTCLTLDGCDLSDHMVESFLPNMLELRSLDLNGNSRVTGRCVDMITGLKQLTQLELGHTSVLPHDLQRLTCLTGLKECSPSPKLVY